MRANYSSVFALGVSLTTDYASIASETLFGNALVLALLWETIFYRRHKVKNLTYEAPTDEWDVLIQAFDLVCCHYLEIARTPNWSWSSHNNRPTVLTSLREYAILALLRYRKKKGSLNVVACNA